MSYTKTTWVNNTTPINETNLNKIESGIENNDINIGEENYDNTRTYEVGDIVRYNEKIYKCITAITTAENFDSSKWEQTNIVEIVQSEKSKIYELIEALSTPIVGEGENITLNDTAEKRFENFDIEGNSEQEASPSSDYPSEVKSCGDNINIFDITKYDYRNNTGATAQITDETTFRITATMNNNANCSTGFKILDLTNYAGKTLSVKAFVKSSTSTNKGFLVLRQNNSDYSGTKTNELSDDSQNTTDGTITLIYKVSNTITDSNRYLFIWFYATRGTVCNIGDYVDYKVKLSEGIDGEGYSEYGQGCITEIIGNKNLFDKDNTEWIRNNSADYHSTGNSNTTRIRTQTLTKLKGDETYTISGFPTGISLNAVKFYENSYSTEPTSTITTSTFTVPSNATYAIFQFAGENFTDATNILMKNANIQVEKSSTSSTYIEHQSQSYTIPTQQPMRAIGNVRDKFILKENGKWYERHYVQRLILNGTEGWNYDKNNNRFYFVKAGNKGSGYIMSSHYLRGDTTKQNNTCEIWVTVILFRDERYTNVNDWKSYLAEQYANGTPVYVDYVLATPTDIECTSEQTEILNQMYIKAKSYKGVTHIYSNDEVSPNCYVEAVKDLTTLIQ